MKGDESETGSFQAQTGIVWPMKWIKKLKKTHFLGLLNSEVQYYFFPTAEDATQTPTTSLGSLFGLTELPWS